MVTMAGKALYLGRKRRGKVLSKALWAICEDGDRGIINPVTTKQVAIFDADSV